MNNNYFLLKVIYKFALQYLIFQFSFALLKLLIIQKLLMFK